MHYRKISIWYIQTIETGFVDEGRLRYHGHSRSYDSDGHRCLRVLYTIDVDRSMLSKKRLTAPWESKGLSARHALLALNRRRSSF